MEQKPDVGNMDAWGVRTLIRKNEYAEPTGGLAAGFTQANLVVLPGEYAFDFLKFCVRNPKPCPILEVTGAGSPEPVLTAPGSNLRTDIPGYRVYAHGEIVEEPKDLLHRWREDLVAFLIGCSFTLEAALIAAGLRIAHIEQGRNVPRYVTGKDCVPSGPFAGPIVVITRPVRQPAAESAEPKISIPVRSLASKAMAPVR